MRASAEMAQPRAKRVGEERREPSGRRDEQTPITFCDPGLKTGKSAKGWFCAYSRPGGNVAFRWRRNRDHASVTDHLEKFSGALQTDAYAPYITFAQQSEKVVRLGCMAHCRRKFKEAESYQPRECGVVLRLMARLYAVEKDIRAHRDKWDRQRVAAERQCRCTNTLARLKRVFRIIIDRTRPRDPARKAAEHALTYWESLCAYVEHGQAEIDNNAIENAIRPTAVGKKNPSSLSASPRHGWLFIGHPKAGDRFAVIYSILISCQRFGVDPREYLCHLFSQDIRKMSAEEIAELTPAAYARSRQAEKSAAA